MFNFKKLKIWQKKKPKLKPRAKKDAAGNLNEEKNLSGLFCANPFEQLDIYKSGEAYSCCSAWLKLPLGNVKNQPATTLWNSEASQVIRASIHDGSFRYCDQKLCPKIQGNKLPTLEVARQNPVHADFIENKITTLEDGPTFINFCNDPSCNLACPSCRVHKVMITSGKDYEEKQAIHNQIVDAFMGKPTDRHFSINVTGSGDPFGSKVYREFLFDIVGNDFPNLHVNLQTNGVMFTEKSWNKLHKIHGNLNNLIISLDAASAETYAITRRGGDWGLLQENLAFLSEKKKEGFFNFFRLDFVVQLDNFTEMPAFAELASRLCPDEIYFSMVTNWGTWPKEIYESKCIWKETHPRFQEFLEVLKHPAFDLPGVDLGNVSHYREIALKAE